MQIGAIISALRKERGLTQRELARVLEISHIHLCQIENDESKPSVALLQKIADTFNFSISALLFKVIQTESATSAEQKRYIKAAEPIVNALIKYLLTAAPTSTKRRSSNGEVDVSKRRNAFPKAL